MQNSQSQLVSQQKFLLNQMNIENNEVNQKEDFEKPF
jgi:hypothetical protein